MQAHCRLQRFIDQSQPVEVGTTEVEVKGEVSQLVAQQGIYVCRGYQQVCIGFYASTATTIRHLSLQRQTTEIYLLVAELRQASVSFETGGARQQVRSATFCIGSEADGSQTVFWKKVVQVQPSGIDASIVREVVAGVCQERKIDKSGTLAQLTADVVLCAFHCGSSRQLHRRQFHVGQSKPAPHPSEIHRLEVQVEVSTEYCRGIDQVHQVTAGVKMQGTWQCEFRPSQCQMIHVAFDSDTDTRQSIGISGPEFTEEAIAKVCRQPRFSVAEEFILAQPTLQGGVQRTVGPSRESIEVHIRRGQQF